MNLAPFVTTVIPSYNHARYVAEAVQSVWAQDYPNHELVVLDDGSTDGSAEILRELATESPIPMRVVARENRGLSATLNEGIAMSAAPYINICPSDDRLTPNKLADLVGALEAADAQTGLAFGDRRFIDQSGQPTQGYPLHHDPSGDRVFLDVVMGRCSIPAPATLYRRHVFDEIGGFNEEVVLEDWDMALRVTDRYKVIFVSDVVVEYRRHSTQTQKQLRNRIAREKVSIFEKWVGKAPEFEDPATLRKARSAVFMRAGAEYYIDGDMAEARRWLLRSLAHNPVQEKSWSLLTRATVGKRPFAVARAVRDAIRRHR